LQDLNLTAGQKIALVFGNEADGVSEECINACGTALEIPQFGSKHSFNISVSAGIVLWEVYKKMTS
jgi:23S rRNA (guanosine2251-2'-O)-methyltransferase